MNKLILFIISLFCASVFAQNTPLTNNEISNLKNQVKKTAEATKTISSDFTQKKHLDFLSNDITTYGKLIYKAPSTIKWEYTKPYKYSVVFKDDLLHINDDGKKSEINLSNNKLFKNMNQLIVKSINGDMFDESMFTINYQQSKKYYIIRFLSKKEEFKNVISEFILHFDKATFEVSTVKMVEPSGDYTKIIFKNRVKNKTINNAIFSN